MITFFQIRIWHIAALQIMWVSWIHYHYHPTCYELITCPRKGLISHNFIMWKLGLQMSGHQLIITPSTAIEWVEKCFVSLSVCFMLQTQNQHDWLYLFWYLVNKPRKLRLLLKSLTLSIYAAYETFYDTNRYLAHYSILTAEQYCL